MIYKNNNPNSFLGEWGGAGAVAQNSTVVTARRVYFILFLICNIKLFTEPKYCVEDGNNWETEWGQDRIVCHWWFTQWWTRETTGNHHCQQNESNRSRKHHHHPTHELAPFVINTLWSIDVAIICHFVVFKKIQLYWQISSYNVDLARSTCSSGTQVTCSYRVAGYKYV